ncbi:HAD-IA family hydrolase [Leifsonia naganoensis]|uniref:Sugar-phosphatase n=1 Tax=Leifsonia naganoensis TaxID=150025 RepID=A0A853DP61_9MICO|nr:HAD-IA family hydrolase [Leifsonia naganoensis]NYK09299.1 sugar-phosphatase [Leifsonia naganoensis]
MDVTARGFLFDMDGTLVDSTPVVEHVWGEFSAAHGLDAAAVLEYAHGRPAPSTVAHFLPQYSAEERERMTDSLLEEEVTRTDGIVEIPGAAALIAALTDAGAPVALVTSAPRALAVARMEAAGVPLPAVVVTPADVEHGKPAPDPYLLGARRLGVPIADCVVFEDVEAGLRAGIDAGARTIVVGSYASATTEGLPRLPDHTGVAVTRDGDAFRLRTA